jgi:hypothetical protein
VKALETVGSSSHFNERFADYNGFMANARNATRSNDKAPRRGLPPPVFSTKEAQRMWTWIECNSSGIQAVVAVIAFLVLCKYAWDTRVLAIAAKEQIETIQRPLLMVRLDQSNNFQVANVGTAAAMNVFWERCETGKISRFRFQYLRTTEPELFYGKLDDVMNHQDRMGWIRYDSPSGRKYRTLFTITEDEQADPKVTLVIEKDV